MNRIRLALLPLLLAAFAPCLAAPSVIWEVKTGNDSSLYLASSVRALPDSAYPLPAVYRQAYEKSSTLLFETNLTYLQDMEVQSKIGIQASYEQGSTTLKQEISPALYGRLGELMADMGVPMFTLSNRKPWMAGLLTEMAVLADRSYWQEKSVDKILYARAEEDGKTIEQLSSVEDFVAPLLALSAEQSEQMLSVILDDVARFRGEENSLIEYWEAGEIEALSSYIDKLNQAYPLLQKSLLAPRNRLWLDAVRKHMNSGEDIMIIADAINLLGSDGLLAQLREAGMELRAIEN